MVNKWADDRSCGAKQHFFAKGGGGFDKRRGMSFELSWASPGIWGWEPNIEKYQKRGRNK
jgi:hypothetical protein